MDTLRFIVFIVWFIGLIAGPLFGYLLTGATIGIDEENWRSRMWLRLSFCFLWPCGAALLNGLLNGYGKGGSHVKRTLSMMLISSYGGYMALNAALDLRGEPVRVERVVREKEFGGGGRRGSYAYYNMELDNGNGYRLDAKSARQVNIGDTCMAVLLPHTDILLDLEPVHRPAAR